MRKCLSLFLFFLCLSNFTYAQGKFVVQNKKGSDKIKFQLINNLIIIPVEINGVTLSFLLDTGVSKPIVFNFINVSDTLEIKNAKKIFLRGLGEGTLVEAYRSKNNVFKIGDAIKFNQDLYAIHESNLNFAPRLGVPVHGILGFDLFKDLIVEINYANKFIRVTAPKKFQYKTCKKCVKFPLEFFNNKPYINVKVSINDRQIPVKLLIDSGGSDSLWLFENDSLGIVSDKKYFNDFLGYGLSGSVYGKRSKIDEIILNKYKLKNANVAYPEPNSIVLAKKITGRNGTLAGNVLKRFNVIFDYRNAIVTFKKNNYFKDAFRYNKSGIEIAHSGVRLVKESDRSVVNRNALANDNHNNGTRIVIDTGYKLTLKPAYKIVELRKDSPAYHAGLQKGDIILSINGNSAFKYALQELVQMFSAEHGKKMKLKVERNGMVLNYTFYLVDFFK